VATGKKVREEDICFSTVSAVAWEEGTSSSVASTAATAFWGAGAGCAGSQHLDPRLVLMLEAHKALAHRTNNVTSASI
jgi:hypothetical protein